MSSTTKEVVTKDRGKDISIPIEVWLGYCHFHHGEYEKALKVCKTDPFFLCVMISIFYNLVLPFCIRTESLRSTSTSQHCVL